jgi:hypothetical protein
MKKIIHLITLLVFGVGCFCSWGILNLLAGFFHNANLPLPAFTTFCVSLRPLLIVLPIMAAVYCVWVWLRKADRVPSWIGFFAATTGSLVLVTLPAMVAAYLPLLAALNHK